MTPVAADKNFTCTVLTPEQSILTTQARFAAIPAFDGEIGVLHDRAPLLCRLGIGIVRLETAEGTSRFFVDAGFAEVHDNTLTILTESAITADQVDVSAERAALESARGRKAVGAEDLERRRRDITRAKAKIKLVAGAA